jgi:hypothetical protein
MSLTAATKLSLGNDYNVAPFLYWSYNGESLQKTKSTAGYEMELII